MGRFSSHAYCRQQCKTHRWHYYLCSLTAPSLDIAGHIWALTAFYQELLHVREASDNAMLRAIRFQWWREAIDTPASHHPVLAALEEDPSLAPAWHLLLNAVETLDDFPDDSVDYHAHYEAAEAQLMYHIAACYTGANSDIVAALATLWGAVGSPCISTSLTENVKQRLQDLYRHHWTSTDRPLQLYALIGRVQWRDRHNARPCVTRKCLYAMMCLMPRLCWTYICTREKA